MPKRSDIRLLCSDITEAIERILLPVTAARTLFLPKLTQAAKEDATFAVGLTARSVPPGSPKPSLLSSRSPRSASPGAA